MEVYCFPGKVLFVTFHNKWPYIYEQLNFAAPYIQMNYEQLSFTAPTIDFTTTGWQFNLRIALFVRFVCHFIEQLDFEDVPTNVQNNSVSEEARLSLVLAVLEEELPTLL